MWVFGCSLQLPGAAVERKWPDLERLGRGAPELGKWEPGPFWLA